MVGRPGPTDRVATLAFPSKNGVALSPHAKGGDTDSPGRRGTDLSVVGSCPVAGEQCEVNDAGLCVSAVCEGVRVNSARSLTPDCV